MIPKEELDRAFDARFPREVKDKLAAAKVAVAGLGGLGSHIAIGLARSGVGELSLFDADTVALSNLNRQQRGRAPLSGGLRHRGGHQFKPPGLPHPPPGKTKNPGHHRNSPGD